MVMRISLNLFSVDNVLTWVSRTKKPRRQGTLKVEVQIFDKNVSLTSSQRELITRRLQFALGRFDEKIRGLWVTFSDVNGPRGGNDKLCRVRLRLHEKGEIVLSENSVTIESAIARVADRAAHKLSRLIERRRIYQRNAIRTLGFS